MLMIRNAPGRKKTVILYISITIALTWLLQFMPIMLGLDVSDTSVSSFDYASIFFTVGGVMPTLVGIVFVFLFYSKEGIKAFLKKCFIPNRYSFVAIAVALALVCFEIYAFARPPCLA